MSLDTAPLLRKKQNFAFSAQTTTGVPATLNAAAGATNIYNPSIKFSTEAVKVEGQGSLSPEKQARGARKASASFESDLVGSGTLGTPPAWGSLLLACGLQLNSGTYTPIDGATQTVTLGHYISGRLRRASDCMGNFKIVFKRGQKAKITWTFDGIQQPPGDATQILPTYQTLVAPQCGCAGFTVGGNTYRVDEVTFDSGNVLIMIEDVTGVDEAGNATGYRMAYITDREAKVTMKPQALPFGTQNWSSIYQAGTTMALSLPVGSVAGNTFTLAAPALQLSKDPEDGDRNGVLVDDLEFMATRGSAGGQDEYSIVMG